MSNKSCADVQPFPGTLSLSDESDGKKYGVVVLSHVKKKTKRRTRKRQGFHVSPVLYSVLVLL